MPYNSGPLLPRTAGSTLSVLLQESNRLHYHLESSLCSFSSPSAYHAQYCFGISTRVACTFLLKELEIAYRLDPSYWARALQRKRRARCAIILLVICEAACHFPYPSGEHR